MELESGASKNEAGFMVLERFKCTGHRWDTRWAVGLKNEAKFQLSGLGHRGLLRGPRDMMLKCRASDKSV